MRIEPLDYQQLKKAKQTYNELSYMGFLLNVEKSFKANKITIEEKLELLVRE